MISEGNVLTAGVHAFVDESGNTDLDTEKPGASKFFVVTAVFVQSDALDSVRTAAERIRVQFFQTGEMKFNGVGAKDHRRKRIMSAIAELNMTTYSLAIDKSRVDRSTGLQYKPSFVKYFNRRLYERAFRIHENLSLLADEHGSEKFRKGFVSYVEKRIPRTLFNRAEFGFADSRHEVMLQVADMVAGTLARALDPEKRTDATDELLALIAKNEVAYDIWPPRPTALPEAFINDSTLSRHDQLVRRHCVRQASLFLQKYADTDSEDVKLQLDVLELLMANLQFGDDKKYIATGRILDRIASQTGVRPTPRRLRSAVSSLRDAGVIVANSTKGYKIPVSEADVLRFVSHTNTIVPAMIARLSRARDDLRAVSKGELDILGHPEFDELLLFVESSKRGPHN